MSKEYPYCPFCGKNLIRVLTEQEQKKCNLRYVNKKVGIFKWDSIIVWKCPFCLKRGEGSFDLMLIPKREAQPINFRMYEEFSPGENKLELVEGNFLPFNDERRKMLMLCLYNMGLQEFIGLLQPETKEELLDLLQKDLKE